MSPSRRRILQSIAAVPFVLGGSASATPPRRRRRALRVAHLTDMHVDGSKGSAEGLAQCLRHVERRTDPVDLVLNTGDTVMCVNAVDEDSARHQWGLCARAFERLETPILHAIGNHDSWGWEDPTPASPMRGKAMAIDVLRMDDRYYRRDVGGWAFLALDSIMPAYTARLDDAQMAWLAAELRRTPPTTPVCVLTHIPIVTACGFFDGDRYGRHGWTIPGSWMHEDAAALKDLFAEHPNVRLCLSGHMHQIDRIDFQGVTYLCGGAVSASWWGGRYYACDYGYALLDLYDDGTFEHEYVGYGWRTRS